VGVCKGEFGSMRYVKCKGGGGSVVCVVIKCIFSFGMFCRFLSYFT
jgi:hypothetical protein